MLSAYRSQPNNTNKRATKASNNNSCNQSHHDSDVERPQRTSIALKNTSNEPNNFRRNKLKGGDPTDNQNDTRNHIEQAFSSD